MHLEILHVSVVVTAESHNPSILHPSFLRAEGIVPAEWELSEQSVSTPAISTVRYSNGISFVVEVGKLQVIENSPPGDPSHSLLPEIVAKYVEALPKVPYTGLGVNPQAFIETADAGAYLIERFLRPNSWPPQYPLSAAAFRFVTAVEGARVRLNFAPGGVRPPNGAERAGILVECNFHNDISGEARAQSIVAQLKQFPAWVGAMPKMVTDAVLGQ